MKEKNIFVYKPFLPLDISDFTGLFIQKLHPSTFTPTFKEVTALSFPLTPL